MWMDNGVGLLDATMDTGSERDKPGKRLKEGVKRTFRRTFSKLGGETMEKQIRKTSVAGYDSGRRRLGGKERLVSVVYGEQLSQRGAHS